MAVIEFSSQNNGIDVQFYSKGDTATSRVVGIEGQRNRLVRYTFTSPAEGASSASMTFYCDGDRQGSYDVPLRFYIGTSETSHVNAGPDSEYHGTLNKTTGAKGAVFTGELDIMLLPNTTYYLWVFPGVNTTDYYGYYSWYPPLDSGLVNSLTLSGGVGIVYIGNGAEAQPYQCYIANGSSWDLYIPYIGNGTSFDVCLPYNSSDSPVVTDALIDIVTVTADNSAANNGTGGSAYAATYSGVYFTQGGFEIVESGYLTIPTDFMAGTDPWTIAFTIDLYIPGSANYSRFARGNNDVPSVFYTKSASAAQAKLAYASAHTANGEIVNSQVASALSSGAIILDIPTDIPQTFVFRNNGLYISLWINGSEILRENTSRYVAEKYASTFSIGDNAGSGYNMSYLKCSMLKAWNRALTDEEIRIIS